VDVRVITLLNGEHPRHFDRSRETECDSVKLKVTIEAARGISRAQAASASGLSNGYCETTHDVFVAESHNFCRVLM